MNRVLLLLMLFLFGGVNALRAEDPVQRVVFHLWMPAHILTPEQAYDFAAGIQVTDKDGNFLPFTITLSDDLKKPVVMTVNGGSTPLNPADIVIHASMSQPTHVTVADISGYTNDDAAESVSVDPVLVPGYNSAGTSSPLFLPTGEMDEVQPSGNQTRAFPNPTDGPINVVTEGDVPFVRAYLSDQNGRILEYFAGQPAERVFFQIKDVPAGIYFLVVQTPYSLVKQIILKY